MRPRVFPAEDDGAILEPDYVCIASMRPRVFPRKTLTTLLSQSQVARSMLQ